VLFLTAVALINPGGSVVEMAGGMAAAVIAAQFWKWAWKVWIGQRIQSNPASAGYTT